MRPTVYLDGVRKLPPWERLLYWVRERDSIRVKRSLGMEAPWTDDPILRTYRFTNVRRMDDRVSRWLLENWYRPHKGHRGMLVSVGLARFVNRPSALSLVTDLIYRDGGREPDWVSIAGRLRDTIRTGLVFGNAYMIPPGRGADKIDSVVNHYTRPLWGVTLETDTMRGAWERLILEEGFASFMAGQVVADLRWAVSGSWKDRGVWAPFGPGSLRGINRLHDRHPDDSAARRNWPDEFGEVMRFLKGRLPSEMTKRLEAIDYQNCLCEYDKYTRGLYGEGRIKNIFTPAPKTPRQVV